MSDDAEKHGKGSFWDQLGCGFMILLICLGLSTCMVTAKMTGVGAALERARENANG